MNLWTVFLTGLLTGGLTCMAVQGGLLATTIAQREKDREKKLSSVAQATPILAFLSMKLISYSILGFLLGWFGSLFQLSLGVQLILQFLIGIFMIGTALNMLEIHPIFRYFAIQPPKFLTRIVRSQSKSGDIFAPAFLGALTIFVPCGTTQAMMALAIATGNPIQGAAIMFAFVLGTSPLFFILGYAATRLSGVIHSVFMKVAAVAIIVLALFSINAAFTVAGSDFTFDNLVSRLKPSYSTQVNGTNTKQTVTEASINIDNFGYSPKEITVKAGSTVTLKLNNVSNGGCQQSFVIPKIGMRKVVPPGQNETITFTAPNQPGDIAFMCSMGMYKGTIHVI
jgi:uncharacterized protein